MLLVLWFKNPLALAQKQQRLEAVSEHNDIRWLKDGCFGAKTILFFSMQPFPSPPANHTSHHQRF